MIYVYIIASWLLVGCGAIIEEKEYKYTAPSVPTTCNRGSGSKCGVTLSNCLNGKKYYCVQDVQEESK